MLARRRRLHAIGNPISASMALPFSGPARLVPFGSNPIPQSRQLCMCVFIGPCCTLVLANTGDPHRRARVPLAFSVRGVWDYDLQKWHVGREAWI